MIVQYKCLITIQKSLESGYSPQDSALDELEDFISNEVYDYSSYVTNDSKVLSNATKLLILSTFLFKLLN
jgi:predicted RNase H-related nuclease YkuK (DUF458 family)